MSNYALNLDQLVQVLDAPEVYRIESIRQTASKTGFATVDYLLKAIENVEPHNVFIYSGSWFSARALVKVGSAPEFSLGDVIEGATVIEITLSPRGGWEYLMQDAKADSFVLNEKQLKARLYNA